MAGMGPPPKAEGERRRRNATVAMTRLPANGRAGKPAPRWPLIPDVVMTARRDIAEGKVTEAELRVAEMAEAGKPTAAAERKLDLARERLLILERQLAAQRKLESSLWKDLWVLPQAVQWERLGWTRDVAQYVRHKVLAELGELDAAKEARQWSDRLGLTPLAMLRLRWEVTPDELGAKREEKAAPAASARTRLKVVDAGRG